MLDVMLEVLLEYYNTAYEYKNIMGALEENHIDILKSKHESLYAYVTILVKEDDYMELIRKINERSVHGIHPIKARKEWKIMRLIRKLLEV